MVSSVVEILVASRCGDQEGPPGPLSNSFLGVLRSLSLLMAGVGRGLIDAVVRPPCRFSKHPAPPTFFPFGVHAGDTLERAPF